MAALLALSLMPAACAHGSHALMSELYVTTLLLLLPWHTLCGAVVCPELAWLLLPTISKCDPVPEEGGASCPVVETATLFAVLETPNGDQLAGLCCDSKGDCL